MNPKGISAGLLLSLLTACSQGDRPASQTEYAVQGLYSAAISSDARYAAVASIQHGGSLWDASRNERLFNWNHRQGQYSNLVAIAFSPEGEYAVTAGQHDIVLWEVTSGKSVGFWNAPAGILDIALSPNGNYALLGLDDQTAAYFDSKNGGTQKILRHEGRVRAVAVSRDGELALTGSDDNRARLWDLNSGEERESKQHSNNVNTVALSPNGRLAFSAGQLEKALIWSADSGRTLQTLSSDEGFFAQRVSYTAAAFSPDSERLLTGTSSGVVQLWNVTNGTQLRRWQVFKRDPLRPTSSTIFALGFAGERYYAVGSNGYINELR